MYTYTSTLLNDIVNFALDVAWSNARVICYPVM